MNKNNTRTNIKLLIVLILLVAMIVFWVRYFQTARDSFVQNAISYNEKGELNYSVCLVKNDYIEESCFTEKRSFITSLIDYIVIKFNYNFSASDVVNNDYNYVIKASVVANERGEQSKVVYTKEEILVNEQSNKNSTANINIFESIKIDYQKYNSLITEFKKTYFLSLDSKLNIVAEVNINNKEVKTIILTIPLSEQTTNIIDNDAKLENNGILTQNNMQKFSFLEDIVLVVSSIVIIVLLFLIIKYIKQIKANNKRYYGRIRYILKHYDEIVGKTKIMPNLVDYRVIEMSSFEELLDIRNNLGKPILFHENNNKTEANFMILNNNEIYLYKIHRDDENEK